MAFGSERLQGRLRPDVGVGTFMLACGMKTNVSFSFFFFFYLFGFPGVQEDGMTLYHA